MKPRYPNEWLSNGPHTKHTFLGECGYYDVWAKEVASSISYYAIGVNHRPTWVLFYDGDLGPLGIVNPDLLNLCKAHQNLIR